MSAAADFAAVGLALYAAHHVGDYWVQTDHQARHKGMAGRTGRDACVAHVASYVLTQFAFLFIIKATLGVGLSDAGLLASLTVSGVTHYLADRREHGPMFWLASKLPGKAAFMVLGRPRPGNVLVHLDEDPTMERVAVDNPQLATGAWALDQAWHIFWGVFVAAILAVAL